MNMTRTENGALMRDGDDVLSVYDADERLIIICGSENGGAGRVFCGPKRFSEALQVFRSDFAQEAIDVYLYETRDPWGVES